MAKLPALAKSKVFRDPVHNLIELSGDDGALILALVDTPEFQRLRRIRQLGLAFLTYPGAEHSRWVHSMGVCHVARRMLDALKVNYSDGSPEFQELGRYRREILVAALLHDVGHGPFSHLFERAIGSPTTPPAGYPNDHEGWSQRIIRERLGTLLTDNGVDVEIVTGLIDKKNRKNLLAKDFISSQLDADRMDYLLRDSRAVGTKYGEFDLDWLLHSLRIGRVPVPGQTDGVWRLCFDSRKAVHAVEEYVQAREFMYLQVYIHRTTRAFEAMVQHVLEMAAAIADGDPTQAPQPCPPALGKMLAGEPVSVAEYLSLDDFCLWNAMLGWSQTDEANEDLQRSLRSKCASIVNRGQPYKCIELKTRSDQDKALTLVAGLRESPLRFSCQRDDFVDRAYRNIHYRKGKEAEEQADWSIHFIAPNGHTRLAESVSDVIRVISDIETEVCRLYYDADDAAMAARLRRDGWPVGTPAVGNGQEVAQ